jgi:hypothetical protein
MFTTKIQLEELTLFLFTLSAIAVVISECLTIIQVHAISWHFVYLDEIKNNFFPRQHFLPVPNVKSERLKIRPVQTIIWYFI